MQTLDIEHHVSTSRGETYFSSVQSCNTKLCSFGSRLRMAVGSFPLSLLPPIRASRLSEQGFGKPGLAEALNGFARRTVRDMRLGGARPNGPREKKAGGVFFRVTKGAEQLNGCPRPCNVWGQQKQGRGFRVFSGPYVKAFDDGLRAVFIGCPSIVRRTATSTDGIHRGGA